MEKVVAVAVQAKRAPADEVLSDSRGRMAGKSDGHGSDIAVLRTTREKESSTSVKIPCEALSNSENTALEIVAVGTLQ